MTLTHDQCRAALAAEARDDTVEAHLSQCRDCRRFDDALARVARLASSPDLFVAPAGLSDRVVERVVSGEVVSHRAARRAGRRWLPRGTVLRSAVAAAMAGLLVVAGLVASSRHTSQPERMALIAAAESIEDERTAAVSVSGSMELAVDRNGRAPDFSALPPEVQGYFEARWAEIMAQFERQVDETLDRADEMLDDAFQRFGARRGAGSPPPPPPPPPAPGAPEPPAGRSRDGGQQGDGQAPDRLSIGFAVGGTGVVDVDGRLQVDGTLRPVRGTLAVPPTESHFGVAVAGDVRAVREPSGRLVAVTDSEEESALASLLTRPRAIPTLLRAASHIETAGEVDLAGERVARYRFTVDDRRAEALLGADGRLRRLIVTDRGRSGQLAWRSTVAIDVTGYGVDTTGAGSAAVSAQAGPGVAPAGRSAILYPFGAAVAESLRGTAP